VSQRRLDEARDEFERLAARQSRPVASLTMVGMIYQMQGRASDARQTFTRALEFDPRAGVAANNLAWMYADAGESLDLALQLAQTAKAALPDQPDVDDTLGWIYYQKGLLPMARRTFERLVTEHPAGAVYQFHLGLTYAKAGDTAKARRALETALRLDSRFSGADKASRVLSGLVNGAL
jgi:Flp pilus assembly protein TadD